jgi:hypothetical protein
MEDEVNLGKILKDVDIFITIRSGRTELRDLRKALDFIVAHFQTLDLELLSTGSESSIMATASGRLTRIIFKFHID